MKNRTHPQFYFCLFVVSAIIFIWLISNLFYVNKWKGIFQIADPDSLLFARLLEQSILKDRIIEYDNYGAFPYEVYTGFGPFYLRFLLAFVYSVFWLFPNLNIDPLYVAGILPVIIPWLTAIILILSVYKLSENKILTLFCAFGMLPGYAFATYSSFFKFDYDFLINFFIWSWLVCCAFYIKKGRHCWAYIASAVVALFISTWNGSPFFFFFVTMYGFVCWLVNPKKYNDYIDFASATMAIGSIIAFIFVPRTEQVWKDFLSGAVYGYSYMQGCLVLAGALFLGFLKYTGRFSKPRTVGLFVCGIISLLLFAVFHSALYEASGLLLKKDPIHSTIAELDHAFDISSIFDDELPKALVKFGPTVCFFPIVFFIGLPELEKKKSLRFLINWLLILFVLVLYQIRYFRWIGCGYGLLVGFTCYSLWKQIKQFVVNRRFYWFKAAIFIIPIMLVILTNSYGFMVTNRKLSQNRVELLQWIKNETPITSGYYDDNKPEYGILTFWDEGNYISYYAKRPVVVSNSMWGFKTMADVFSSEDEKQAYGLCKKHKLRYIIVSPINSMTDKMLRYLPLLKDLPERPEYNLYYKDLPERDSFDYFYFWLSNHLGLTSLGSFGTSEHFRLVFANQSEKNVISRYLMFQCVEGALIKLRLDPYTKVSASLEFKASEIPFIYKINKVVDDSGVCEIRLPYANAYDNGRVTTDSFYKVSFEKDGIRKLAELRVPEEAVVDGLTLDLDKHLNYLSTF